MYIGTKGEQSIQAEQNSRNRAERFYKRQMQSHLSDKMVDLIKRQEMVFIATSDAEGNCDCSPRFGKSGFVSILDKQTLTYPEYRGNGVFASLGNILENPHIGMVFIDFFDTTVGLHINGTANSYNPSQIPDSISSQIIELSEKVDSEVERWVVIKIDEAYIHCSKHVPALSKRSKRIQWGTDDKKAKSSDFFIEKTDCG